jgi:hypothetical protein
MRVVFIVVLFMLIGCSASRLAELPAGCSGSFQTDRESALDCIADQTRITSIVFSKPQTVDLESTVSCGIKVSGLSSVATKARVVVVLLDADLKELGSSRIADFLRPEVSATTSKFVSDKIAFSKGASPAYYKVIPSEPAAKEASE